MTDERTFLDEHNVYVSNSRVVIHGTTYATANVTSVRKTYTPAKTGCAALLVVVGALAALGGLTAMLGAGGKSDDGIGALFMGVVLLAIGFLWFQSLKPVYHVMLASSSGERQGLSSMDEGLVDRTTAAIAEAIIYRG
jgi:hypothetical protein